MAGTESENSKHGTEPARSAGSTATAKYGQAFGSIGKYARRPLVILGLFGLAYAVFAFQYYQVGREQSLIETNINNQKLAVGLPVPDTGAVVDELTILGAQQEALEFLRVSEMPDSEIMAFTLAAAAAAGVRVHQEGAMPAMPVEIDGVEYIATAMQIQADGMLPDLQLFLDEFELRTFETLEIQNITLGALDSGYSMHIRAIVYSQMEPVPDGNSANVGLEGATGSPTAGITEAIR